MGESDVVRVSEFRFRVPLRMRINSTQPQDNGMPMSAIACTPLKETYLKS